MCDLSDSTSTSSSEEDELSDLPTDMGTLLKPFEFEPEYSPDEERSVVSSSNEDREVEALTTRQRIGNVEFNSDGSTRTDY